MSEAVPILDVQQLEVAYGEKVVLREVSFKVHKGELLYLQGLNGSGKTSLMRVLAGIKQPVEGSIEICGRDLFKDDEVRASIGVVGHQPMLQAGLTPKQNLIHTLQCYGVRNLDSRLREVTERFDLSRLVDKSAGSLSRGQQQRVALAKAWVTDPDLYLIDEPFNALDAAACEIVHSLLRAERDAGKAIVLTSHSREQGLALATHCATLAEKSMSETTAMANA